MQKRTLSEQRQKQFENRFDIILLATDLARRKILSSKESNIDNVALLSYTYERLEKDPIEDLYENFMRSLFHKAPDESPSKKTVQIAIEMDRKRFVESEFDPGNTPEGFNVHFEDMSQPFLEDEEEEEEAEETNEEQDKPE